MARSAALPSPRVLVRRRSIRQRPVARNLREGDRRSRPSGPDDPLGVEPPLARRAGCLAPLRVEEIENCPLVIALEVRELVAGEFDRNASPGVMRKMADQITGAEFTQLAGMGHLMNLEAPEAFDAAVLDFLARHHHHIPSRDH